MAHSVSLTISPKGRTPRQQCEAFIRGALVDYNEKDGRQIRRHTWTAFLLGELLRDADAVIDWLGFFRMLAVSEQKTADSKVEFRGCSPISFYVRWEGGDFRATCDLGPEYRAEIELAWHRNELPHVTIRCEDRDIALRIARAMDANGTWFTFAGRPEADTPEGAIAVMPVTQQ